MKPQELIDLTNQYRASLKLPPVKLNPVLQKAAEMRAAYIAQTQKFSHQADPGMDAGSFMVKAGYGKPHEPGTYLENLAEGFGDAKSVLNAWQNSPLHQQNMTNKKVTDIGLAVVPGMYQGKPTQYVVQFFGGKDAQPTASKLTTAQNAQLEAMKQQLLKMKLPGK